MRVSPPRARSSDAQSVAQCARPAAASSLSLEPACKPKKRYTTKKPAVLQQLSQKSHDGAQCKLSFAPALSDAGNLLDNLLLLSSDLGTSLQSDNT